MRTLILTLGAATLLSAVPAEGQSRIPRRAFVPAVTPWVGVAGFGQRLEIPDATFRYGTSVAFGATGDMPLTRRTALMGTLGIAPSRQRGEGENDSRFSGDGVSVLEAELGLAARLRPSVPVFFYAGAGVLRASAYALQGVEGSAVEPRGTLAIGYDTRQSGRLAIRILAGAHFGMPAEPAADSLRLTSTTSVPITTKGGAVDWSVRFGLRYALRASDGESR